MTSTQKGNVGLSLAIGYFGSNGYTVSIPLTDTQDYDLIVDKNDAIQRVQVKYTDAKSDNGIYIVGLRVVSGSTRKVIKKCSECHYDLLFIVCGNRTRYLISKDVINNERSINLSQAYDKYIVTI